MDKLLIDAEFMRIGYALAIPLIFIYFLTVIIKNHDASFGRKPLWLKKSFW